ncbi:hypothetical protein [Halorussus caseinilyticus]|uniref:Uncharacterized protein n=1 Tax=Halorussus caseinilyticus TaxID=3034025 RepID=A0ABD5WIF8_9EURY|nr:hypothetical protein [Halorussus sp. DT72]
MLGEGNEAPDDREAKLKQVAEERDLDPDALERAHSDAQLVLEQTLQTFSDLSDTAFRLVRLNGLVLTILVAVSSNVRNLRTYVNVLSVGAVLLFIGSAFFATLSYTRQTVDGGVSTDAFDKLTEYKLREDEYLNWVLTLGYPKWIENGVEKSDEKEQWIEYSLLAFLGAIMMLLGRMLLSIYTQA